MVGNVVDMESPVGALLFWASTALTCIERVFVEEDFSPWPRRVSDRPSTLVRQGDAALTLLALRNLLRAAKWCARDLRPHISESEDWIAEFHRRVPDLISARDALEHFDDYAVGRGHLQTTEAESFSFSFSGEAADPSVTVGCFSIGLQSAKDACRWLVIQLLAATERVQPHTRSRSLA
jgi:hypothetical protein